MGKHKKLLGVLIVEGHWTRETLRIMANVFDYVIPLTRVSQVVESIKQYLDGDETKLKWLVDFSIIKANNTNSY